MADREPRVIIGDDAYMQLTFEGYTVERTDTIQSLRAALAKSEEARETAERERANIWRWNREVFADLTTAQAVSATFEASLSQALARIEELEKAQGWQTMDTAPKDGSQFLAIEVWYGGMHARIYRWVGEPNCWLALNGQVCIRPEDQQRFHWISLPATPIDGGKG